MIRDAIHEDIADILILGEQFFNESRYADIIEFNDSSVSETVLNLIESENGILLVSEVDSNIVGIAGALLYPFYFNANHLTGQELFWWVSPEYRGGSMGIKLFKALEEKARSLGAKSFSMVSLDSVNPEMMDKIYHKSGYRNSEHTYIKAL